MKLRELILHNFRLKAFALLIAVLVWGTIHLATKRHPLRAGAPAPASTNQPEH